MAVSRTLARGSIGLVTALLLAPAAGALQITGLTVAPTALNTANSGPASGNNGSQVASSTNITIAPGGAVPDTIGQVISFQTQYAALVARDRDNNGSAQTSSMTSDYSITFTVSNPTGATYRVDIDTLRAGALTVVDDDAGDGTATLGAVTGRLDTVVNASLGLAVFPTFTSGATAMSAFNQTSTTLSITDNAVSRTFTLNFNWASSATTNNDESAVRMGINGGVTSMAADDYPGAGALARTIGNDGHFVTVATTILAPEPGAGALVALGLLGLAMRARRVRAHRR